MKSKYLFPKSFKTIGWLLFVPALIAGLCFYIIQLDGADIFDRKVLSLFPSNSLPFSSPNTGALEIINNNIFDEIIGVFLIVGAVFIAFSRTKNEDEFVSKIRLDSLVWAIYVNYGILILALIFVYDMAFFDVMVFNLFTPLIFFVIRFEWLSFRSKNELADEE